VALNLVLVPHFGINGAAATVLIVVLIWAIWLHGLVVRHLGIQPSVLAFRSAITRVAHRESP
jgi:O-antigen/teichoic acid export membrane protein